MMKFESIGWYRIVGTPSAVTVRAPDDIKISELVGQVVNVDGYEVQVRGVECYALNMIRQGDEIALVLAR